MPDTVEYLNCDCSLLTHTLRASVLVDRDGSRSMYLEVLLSPQASLWKRVRSAVWHVLGRATPYGAFDEFVVNPADAARLRSLLDELDPPATSAPTRCTWGGGRGGPPSAPSP